MGEPVTSDWQRYAGFWTWWSIAAGGFGVAALALLWRLVVVAMEIRDALRMRM